MAVPTTLISAFMKSLETFYLNSPSFLAWIKSVNSGETTNLHVYRGYRPDKVVSNRHPLSHGPIAALRFTSGNFYNASQGARAYVYDQDVVVEYIIGMDWKTKQDFTIEQNYMGQITAELTSIGIPLDGTYTGSGHILSGSCGEPVAYDPNDRRLFSAEWNFTVRAGYP